MTTREREGCHLTDDTQVQTWILQKYHNGEPRDGIIVSRKIDRKSMAKNGNDSEKQNVHSTRIKEKCKKETKPLKDER